jgi:hypothetical protein
VLIVHLRLLPGLVDEYRALVDRALAQLSLHTPAIPVVS